MKLSNLIESLQAELEEHGDIQTCLQATDLTLEEPILVVVEESTDPETGAVEPILRLRAWPY